MAILSSGQCLQPGQSLQSDNQLHTLIMQTDGNVVLYDHNSQPLWSTDTGGLITPRDFAMQDDGNLVLYDTDGSPRWASGTYGNPGAFLNIQDDGNLVVYRAGAQVATEENALWAAGSNDIWAGVPNGAADAGSAPVNSEIQEILAAHNQYRAAVGVQPLNWSDSLARNAQVWADRLLSEIHQLVHSGDEERPGQGENLWWLGGPGGTYTHAIQDWGSEKDEGGGNYNHYTQVVWRDTTEVGCAKAEGEGETFIVCRYSPVGNIMGQSPF